MTAGRSAGTEQGQGRCSALDCGYTLPVVAGLIVPHSAPMTLDNCEGSSRPPFATPARDSVSPDCVFCKIVAGDAPATILGDWGSALVIVPHAPVVQGHVLVLPKAHVSSAVDSPEVTAMTMRYTALYAREHYNDCNIITSVGPAATQTVRHLHVHIVPRAADDGLTLPWTGQGAA